ncbi:MAG: DUF465 domain-containing protein [Thermodesulfovibrionales bacterium]|nr:DUF465 domain-containing protein [Thermodesulfovibrionales bacterium]
MKETEIIETLKTQNEEFRKLYNEHRELDRLLLEMEHRNSLTEEEEIEKKRLKKEKLYKKDKIAEYVRNYKKQHNL